MRAHIRQSGLALVLVLWVLTLLTIMAASFALTMRRETVVIASLKDNAARLAAAEAGIAVAQQMLLLSDEQARWRADGSIYHINYDDAEIRVRLFSEDGKVDINKVGEKTLTALMDAVDLEFDKQGELVSAILDWRDEDDLVHINGAEKKEYEEAGLNYYPTNKPFQLIDELKMVLGMDEAIFKQLKPLITVYSGKKKVNLKLASREVIDALGNLEQEVTEDYLLKRKEHDLQNIPAPEFPLGAQSALGAAASKTKGGQSQAYTLLAQARIDDQTGPGIKAVLKRDKGEKPFQILYWQHQFQGLSLFSDEMEHSLISEHEPE